SVPGQSRAARSRYRRAAGERARPRGPRTDQSSAANDRLEHAFRVKIRRTGHPARPDVPPSSHSPPASTTRVNQRSRILAITSFSTKSALSGSSVRDWLFPFLPLYRPWSGLGGGSKQSHFRPNGVQEATFEVA